MFGIGMPELIIVLLIILVIFGAGKLPEIGGGMGKAIKNFKRATTEIEKKKRISLTAAVKGRLGCESFLLKTGGIKTDDDW